MPDSPYEPAGPSTRNGHRHHRRHVCRLCGEHRALFRMGRAVRADRDHELCFRCFRAVCNSARARKLARAA